MQQKVLVMEPPTSRFYILNRLDKPVPASSNEWIAEWPQEKSIDRTHILDITISTVFIGIQNQIFETAALIQNETVIINRSKTIEAARRSHRIAVYITILGLPLDILVNSIKQAWKELKEIRPVMTVREYITNHYYDVPAAEAFLQTPVPHGLRRWRCLLCGFPQGDFPPDRNIGANCCGGCGQSCLRPIDENPNFTMNYDSPLTDESVHPGSDHGFDHLTKPDQN